MRNSIASMTASHSETPSTKPDASTLISDHQQVDRSKLSQMYLHYVETKDKYPHAVLLYRVGDFFECYFQDAVETSTRIRISPH